MRKVLLVILIFINLINSGCKKDNPTCPLTIGDDITEMRNLKGFNSILVKDEIDVYFSQTKDSSYKIEVIGGKNIVPNIKTEIDGNYLLIENESKCNFLRSYKRKISVHVSAPHLIYVVNDGVGNFYATDTIHEDFIDYTIKNSGDIRLVVNAMRILGHMHGAGDIFLNGSANAHLVNSVGQSFIRAENLSTGYSEIHFRSSGQAKINVSGFLDVKILASGNVFYKGNPGTIIVERTGNGKLIQE